MKFALYDKQMPMKTKQNSKNPRLLNIETPPEKHHSFTWYYFFFVKWNLLYFWSKEVMIIANIV